jgi:hypothetical protein
MKEIDRDDVPDISGGVRDGCIPMPPIIITPLPGIGDPFPDPFGGLPRKHPIPTPVLNA